MQKALSKRVLDGRLLRTGRRYSESPKGFIMLLVFVILSVQVSQYLLFVLKAAFVAEMGLHVNLSIMLFFCFMKRNVSNPCRFRGKRGDVSCLYPGANKEIQA